MHRERTLAAFGALIAVIVLPGAASAQGRYLVQLRDQANGRAALAAAGAEVVLELEPQRAVAAHVPEQALEGLRHNPHIELLEPDPVRMPLAQTTPYGIGMVQAKDAQSTYGVTGGNRKVCVIDSGLFVGHEDLQTNGLAGYPSGWNTDGCGHGTHVTGTIAALNNGLGVEGVLPSGVSLYLVKVFGADCSWAYASTLMDAANRCKAAGANIISMSLGGGGSSSLEASTFANLYSAGILSVAAAGNDGSGRSSYPASYPSVISVAAVDSNRSVASFSQHNAQVELAAPGVGVLSTVPWADESGVTVGSTTWSGNHVENAGYTSGVGGALVNGGQCTSTGPWAGKVVLCERGTNTFVEKVMYARLSGAVAALLYNNVSGELKATLGAGNTSDLPAISLSQAAGQELVSQHLGKPATVVAAAPQAQGSGYEAWNGTSMATPHVAGVAALVWSYNPAWTNAQVRQALRDSAEDLGAGGRDDYYGYGLVRARAALDLLLGSGGGGGGGGGGGDETGTLSLSVTTQRLKGAKVANLSWSGATGAEVDIFRDGRALTTTDNDGAYSDKVGKTRQSSFTYRVCEAGSAVCSGDVVVTF